MTYSHKIETNEVYQLKRELDLIKGELDMYKCYKTANEKRISKLKQAQRNAHLRFKGVIYIED